MLMVFDFISNSEKYLAINHKHMKKVNVDLMLGKKTESHFLNAGSRTSKVSKNLVIAKYLNIIVHRITNVDFFELNQKGLKNTKNYIDIFFLRNYFNCDSFPKQVFGITSKDTLKFQTILRFELEYIKTILIKCATILQVLLIKIYVILIP